MVAVIVQVELGSAGEVEKEKEEVVSKVFFKTTQCTFTGAITHSLNKQSAWLVCQCVNVCEPQQIYMAQSLHLERMQCS